MLSYDGTDYCGWQVQPGRPSVQQAVTEALRRITGETAVVHGSGRTDAGVHALAQVANVRLTATLPARNLRRALNAVLAKEIRVLEVAEAAPEFHARHDAIAKLYRYRLYRAEVCPPFVARYVCAWPYPLDEAAMIAAAGDFAGEHDFTSFAARGDRPRGGRTGGDTAGNETAGVGETGPTAAGERDAVRRVLLSRLRRCGEELIYEIAGTGFLHHMVRNIMGFLIEIGRGQRRREEIATVLAARHRRQAGHTAPARGLALVRVFYDSQELEEGLAGQGTRD